jgi:hypothetical protein
MHDDELLAAAHHTGEGGAPARANTSLLHLCREGKNQPSSVSQRVQPRAGRTILLAASIPQCCCKLSLSNKLLIYKVAIKPIWTYGIQLWGAASTSNAEILERFQSKALRMITSAPWCLPNTVIRHDPQVPTVKEEIRLLSANYITRLCTHPNLPATQLRNPPTYRRLKRHLPVHLAYRFPVQR